VRPLGFALVLALGCSERAQPLDTVPAPTTRVATTGTEPAPADAIPEPAPVADDDGPHLRLLGTAQDGGLPHAACTCPRCDAARHDAARARLVASVAIVDPGAGQAFMVDATPDIHEQLHALHDVGDRPEGRADRAPVAGILLTHAHIGHYLGLALLGFEAVHTRELPVWASPRMSEYLRQNGPWEQMVRIENIDLRPVGPEQRIELTPALHATPLLVPHRDEYTDTYGFLIEGPHANVLYVPDTSPWRTWSTPLPEFLEAHEVDVALLDATFYSGDELPGRDLDTLAHPLVVDTMDLLQPLVDDGKVKVYFTHLNHSNPALDPSGPELAEIRRRGFEVASDGQHIPL
jgi:pyrroloquinoline quinone biosynthesis protein B